MEYTLMTLLNGISYGLLLFMLSSGLTLIFSMMGVLNFAHASFYMLGAYFAYTISTVLGFWGGLFLAPLLVGGIGALVAIVYTMAAFAQVLMGALIDRMDLRRLMIGVGLAVAVRLGVRLNG